MPQKTLTSKAFQDQKRAAGKEFRDGIVGEALDDLYVDIDTGFNNLEQTTIAALVDGTTGSTPNDNLAAIGDTTNANESGAINANFRELVEKTNAILVALKAAGIIADA